MHHERHATTHRRLPRTAGPRQAFVGNLDRLASEGVIFENCYVQNPVCAPSRASLMTGRYVPSHGLYANGVDISPDEELFSRRLADAGYDIMAGIEDRSRPRLSHW